MKRKGSHLNAHSGNTTCASLLMDWQTCHEAVGCRAHSVVACQALCHHSDAVGVAALQSSQGAVCVAGVTGDCQVSVTHSLNRVRRSTSHCVPHHPGSTQVVVDGHICRNAGLWRENKLNGLNCDVNETKGLAETSTCGEVSCHLRTAVTSLSNSLHSDVVFLSASQRPRLTAGLVGGAAGCVSWRSCEHSNVEHSSIAGLPRYVGRAAPTVVNHFNIAWLTRSCGIKNNIKYGNSLQQGTQKLGY